MSDLTVTKTRLFQGVWEGIVSGAPKGQRPTIAVTHLEQPVPDAELTETADGGWHLRIPVPRAARWTRG